MSLQINHEPILHPAQNRVEDRLMNYLLAGELFTKIDRKPIDLHYNTISPIIIFSLVVSGRLQCHNDKLESHRIYTF